MPPKGTRVCFDSIPCSHGKEKSIYCRACLDNYAMRVARQEVYLCGDCRTKSIREMGYKWPAKGTRKLIPSQPIPTADLKISATCYVHKRSVSAGKYCNGCFDEFQQSVGECGSCNGYDPTAMKRMCKKHHNFWEERKLRWRFDPKVIDIATPYPTKTEDFLKGMTELCFDPRKK